MQVVLRVVGGKNNGRDITISVPEFIIGRGDEAHLKPASDLVSRHHCAIRIADGKVVIEDLKSRNGTFVNGSQLTEAHTAKTGDTLRVGRLQFEVHLDHAKAGAKKPKVAGVVDAATRTATAGGAPSSIEDSISDWLTDETGTSEPDTSVRQAWSNADTVQLNLEETTSIPKPESSDDLDVDEEETMIHVKSKKTKKEKPGKLPPVPKFSHDDSTTAADDVLRKFFNRGRP